MKVSDIMKVYDKDKSLDELGIKVESCISIAKVSIMVKEIAESCLDVNDDSLLECDFIAKKLNRDIAIMFYFAGIEFADEGQEVEQYDWIVSKGIYDKIIDSIDVDQIWMIKKLIDDEINQRKEMVNSIEASMAKIVVVLEKGINAIIKKLPSKRQVSNLLKETSKTVEGFDPDKIDIVSGLLNKLKN